MDGPYWTAPKGVPRNTFTQLTHVNTLQLVHVQGEEGEGEEGLKRRLVNTTAVPKRNIDHVNVVSRLSRIHAIGIFRLARFQLIKHSANARKRRVIYIGHCSIDRRARYNGITKAFKRRHVSMRSIFVR